MGKGTYDLDSVLNEIGQFGRFQLLSCTLICLPIMFNAISTLSYVFTASGVDQRCRIGECDSQNATYLPPWINNSVPFENGIPSKCSRYQSRNLSDGHFAGNDNYSCPVDLFNISKIITCDEFVYKNDEKTIATEWDISCPNDEWKLTLIGTLNNVGQFVSMPLGGFLSDRYGRRTSLAIAGTLSALMGIIRSFSINYPMFAAFEVIDAVVGSSVYPSAMILGMELVGPKQRVLASTILAVFYPIGEVIMGLVAKYVSNWRVFLRILYIPGLLHIFFFWAVTESIRWLLVQGKNDQAVRSLKRAAKFNKILISDDSLAALYKKDNLNDDTDENADNAYPIRLAFTSSTLLWRIVNCSFCWFTNTLVYYGLSLNSVSLAGDKYLNFILVCVIEIPGFLICYFVMNFVGRRFSQSGSLILSGVACLLSFFVSNEQPWLGFTLFLIGKLAITISFTVLYVYTSELFPTSLRQSLLSFCSMFGRIGSMIAPQTPLIALYVPSLPLILFGSCAILSGLLVLKFPETLNTKLPTTIFDAEHIGEESSSEQNA